MDGHYRRTGILFMVQLLMMEFDNAKIDIFVYFIQYKPEIFKNLTLIIDERKKLHI